MMEILVDNRYNQIYFDHQTSIHYHITKKDTMHMSEEEFKDMLFVWKKSIATIRPQYSLVDNRNFNFFIAPDLQVWVSQNITNPAVEKLDKFCFVMPEEFIANLSITQLTQEANQTNNEKKVHFFGDFEKAKQWILGDS